MIFKMKIKQEDRNTILRYFEMFFDDYEDMIDDVFDNISKFQHITLSGEYEEYNNTGANCRFILRNYLLLKPQDYEEIRNKGYSYGLALNYGYALLFKNDDRKKYKIQKHIGVEYAISFGGNKTMIIK